MHPVFARVAWERGRQIQECAPRGHEANASPGVAAHSEAPGRSSGAGQQQHPKPEKQDSQHKLHQPRGSFPDFESLLRLSCPVAKLHMLYHPGRSDYKIIP